LGRSHRHFNKRDLVCQIAKMQSQEESELAAAMVELPANAFRASLYNGEPAPEVPRA
jgi:hypothetical protein